MSKTKYQFISENSTTVAEIENLTDNQLVAKYFTKGKQNGEDWHDEFDYEINKELPNKNNQPKYPLCQSLVGSPLDYIANGIKFRVLPYIPEGYKLKPSGILEDCEKMLNENKKASTDIVISGAPTEYLTGMCSYITSTLFRGVDILKDVEVDLYHSED